ncbi:hypothetical protein LTS12_029664 [Elasticomyces elasticus]|nr:hypothetical protein LTS12_029664 [Elasticomyces elasticus]
MVTIFMQGWNYLLDSYREFAASAFAANMMLRSLVGACFPLFTTQMFGNLGVQWASTLLGCIAAIMIPIPIIFRIYGKTLREKSQNSRS